MIAGPWILVLLPLAAAALVYMVRRWAFLGALLAGGTTGALAWLCFTAPLAQPVTLLEQSILMGEPVAVLGRELVLTPVSQIALGFLFAIAAVSFLLAWPLSPGRSFFPLGLVLLSGWAAAILMQHLAFAVIILWLVSTLATMVIQGGRLASIRGAGRQMIILTLVIPLLLLVSTLIDARAVNPDDFTLTQPVILLTAIGLAGLFAAFPFEGWVAAMTTDAQPGVVALLISGYQVVVLLLALNLFHDQPWLVADGQILSLLAWGGLLTAAIGGLLAAVQRHFTSLLGYTILNDLGLVALAMANANDRGLTIAFTMIAVRPIGLLLAGSGLALIRQRAEKTSFLHLAGLGHSLPLAAISLLAGGFSLSGIPLTAGFAARWALLNQVASSHSPWIWVLLVSSLGTVAGWLNGARTLFTPAVTEPNNAPPTRRMPLVATILVIILLAACLWLGHRPDWLLLWLQPLVDTYAPLVTISSLASPIIS